MEKLIAREKELKKLLKKCSISEAIEISHLISPEFESVFNKYYIKGKTLRAISRENGTSFQNIHYRRKKSISEINRVFEDKQFIAKNQEIINGYANNSIAIKIRKRASKLMENLDYRTEVRPFLEDEEKYVFENFISDFNEKEYLKLNGESNWEKNQSLFSKCRHVLWLIDIISNNKKDQEEFMNLVGGMEGLSDILDTLTEDEITLIDEAILELSPYSNSNFRAKYGLNCTEFATLKKSLFSFAKDFSNRRDESKKFIEENGGEIFLLHEFGSTLDDADFFVLSTTMMDYHYRTKREVSLEGEEEDTFVSSREYFIRGKLKKFLEKKSEVDSLVSRIGGEQGLKNLCSGLSNEELTILLEYILAYNPKTKKELRSSLGISYEKFDKIFDELNAKIGELSLEVTEKIQN